MEQELLLDSDTLTWDEAVELADQLRSDCDDIEHDERQDDREPDEPDWEKDYWDGVNEREAEDERRAGIR